MAAIPPTALKLAWFRPYNSATRSGDIGRRHAASISTIPILVNSSVPRHLRLAPQFLKSPTRCSSKPETLLKLRPHLTHLFMTASVVHPLGLFAGEGLPTTDNYRTISWVDFNHTASSAQLFAGNKGAAGAAKEIKNNIPRLR